ncbi:MAG: hypothetical protein ABI898_06525 [Sphingomonadales bacterium]
MKRLLRIAGLFALLMGLLWMGQGSGIIMWPQSSFMLDQRIWTVWGALLAAVGVVALVISRRR